MNRRTRIRSFAPIAPLCLFAVLILTGGNLCAAADRQLEWKAGIATVVITPDQPMWMR